MFESVFTAAGKNLPRLFATSLIVLGFEFPIMFISHYYFNLPYWGIGAIMVGTGIIYIITDYILFSTKMWEVNPN
jgi:Na+-driven multidrug efflux pump